ncbi:phage tail protein [Methylocaldum gracile]|jgi:phage tail-like protein|uniref:phage tail protein n=1 Tax=unclassified Methylocaldum TaxID=2622260 RepID=UPI00105F404E
MKHIAGLTLALGLVSITSTAAAGGLPVNSSLGSSSYSANIDSSSDPASGMVFELQAGEFHVYFSNCTLGSETEVTEHKVVSQKGREDIVQKIPGRLKMNSVVCMKALDSGADLWAWRQMIIEGKLREARKSGSLIAYDYTMAPIATWSFFNGWPSSVSLGNKDHKLVEIVVLAVEGILRDR